MNSKYFIKFLVSIAFVAASISANAGSATGTVSYLIVRKGLVYFELNGAAKGRPACAANTNYFMIKDEASSYGKQQLALVLAAKIGGRSVTVEGAGQCAKYSDGEDVSYVMLQ